MAVELTWESADLLIIKYINEISGDQAYQASLKMSGDSRFDRLRAIIIDASTLRETKVSEKDIEKIAALTTALSKTNPRIKNAVVMAQDESSQSLSAFYKFLSDNIDWEVEIFHTEQEARQWLK